MVGSVGWLVEWPVGWLGGWFVCLLVFACLFFGWLVGCLAGLLVGLFVDWLVDWVWGGGFTVEERGGEGGRERGREGGKGIDREGQNILDTIYRNIETVDEKSTTNVICMPLNTCGKQQISTPPPSLLHTSVHLVRFQLHLCSPLRVACSYHIVIMIMVMICPTKHLVPNPFPHVWN